MQTRGTGVSQIFGITQKTGGFYHAGRILNPTNPIRLAERQRGEKISISGERIIYF